MTQTALISQERDEDLKGEEVGEQPGEKVGIGVWRDEGNSHEMRGDLQKLGIPPGATEDAPRSDQLLVYVHSVIFLQQFCAGN